jgi:predicted transcriptional regulator of viral defense system
MDLEDRVLIELHRSAVLAGRPTVSVPSQDLQVADQLTGSRPNTRQALSRLARAGRITAVRRDLIVLPDTTGRTTVELPELVDTVAPLPYLITGGRALQHHRLTDQHYFSTTVLAPVRVHGFSYRGETAVFLIAKASHIWGWQNDERPRFATPERAVIDALSHSRYGVPLQQAIRSVQVAVQRNPAFVERLVETARRYRSAATARRTGFLVDRLFGSDAAAPFLEMIGKSRTPTLLRPTGASDGDIDHRWRLIVNATTELGTTSS